MSENIHFIAIGGSAMHNLALALHDMGHIVTGSDDEIYEPSRSRLAAAELLPEEFGWYPDKLHKGIDAIILGMHARADNIELLRAKELGLPIYSYPEYVARASADQQCVVIAGSHGKTTTTAMIMHVLTKYDYDYDYLVGAQLEGFDRMVRLSGAPLIILEGDEYLSSPIDRRPKIMHYKPNIAVITGVAWDHINVFPSYDIYEDQFRQFVHAMHSGSHLIHYAHDQSLQQIVGEGGYLCSTEPYDITQQQGSGVVASDGSHYQINVIGAHNLQNMAAAYAVCSRLGLTESQFYDAIQDFRGAAKRLQYRGARGSYRVYQDFAHAPSKVKATTTAVKEWFGAEKLYAVLELHTFSSLNREFLPLYAGALSAADAAYVVYDDHTLAMKKMPPLDQQFVKDQFGMEDLQVITDNKAVQQIISDLPRDGNLLMMSSGTFGGLQWDLLVD